MQVFAPFSAIEFQILEVVVHPLLPVRATPSVVLTDIQPTIYPCEQFICVLTALLIRFPWNIYFSYGNSIAGFGSKAGSVGGDKDHGRSEDEFAGHCLGGIC